MTTGQRAAHIVVVANGTFRHVERLRPYFGWADLIVAADGAADWLLHQRVSPDLVIGDMDSVSARTLERLEANRCEIRRFPAHKDETDLELALLAAAEYDPEEIVILGALGGRIDHELANILLLSMSDLVGIRTLIYDGTSFISLARGEAVIRGKAGDTVSLIPLGGDVTGVTTQGLDYPLKGEPLLLGPARGVSNVLSGDRAHVQFEGGLLLVIHTPQAHLDESEVQGYV